MIEEAKVEQNSILEEQVDHDPLHFQEVSHDNSKVGENNEWNLKQDPGQDLKLESDLIMATNPVSQQQLQYDKPEPAQVSTLVPSDAKHHLTPQKKAGKQEP